MDRVAIAEAAALLAEARRAARPVPDLPPELTPVDANEAYVVQRALSEISTDEGAKARAGWKIGATTPGMQEYLGVDGPAFGRIRASDVHRDGAALAASDFCNPGIECEIAVRIGRDTGDVLPTREGIAACIAAVLPAIEIVENRYGDFLARGAPTLIADDFFHKACVLGDEITGWRELDLAAIEGRTLIDGAERGTGSGAAVMGHPLEAVVWLARTLAEQGEALAIGEIVLTGSLAPVIWIDGCPCDARIELAGLGSVSVSFS